MPAVESGAVAARRALLVIDVQQEYFAGPLKVSHPAGSLPNLLKAYDGALAAGVPVLVVQHSAPDPASPVFKPGSESWQLHREVARRRRDHYIEKHLPGSFSGTDLEDWLEARSLDTLTICGYMSHMCCDTTARQAAHRGLKVEFLSDATGTLDLRNAAGSITAADLHRAVLVVQAQRFSTVLDTDAWLTGL